MDMTELTTLMVIDEFDQGFPAAFMFSNRKDTYIYTLFFKMIKNKVGIISSRTFMSDMEESFYVAWQTVMGKAQHVLFCSWHVDRAWQSNLNKITDKDKRSEVYKMLKVLQQKTEESQFEQSLQNAVSFMKSDNDTKKFGIYFEKGYCGNYEKWAYCFRTKCGINTNMHLESMHKVVKYFYLNRKKVKRLDKGLHVILKYLKNKSVERIIKLTKGKSTKASRKIFLAHNKALDSKYSMEELGEASYVLQKESGESYEVKKVLNEKCCRIVCSSCKICLHMFTCTCYDHLFNTSICKHIHYILQNSKTVVNAHVEVNNIEQVGGIENTDVAEENAVDMQQQFPVNASLENALNKDELLKILASAENNPTKMLKLSNRVSNAFAKLQQVNYEELDDSVAEQINHHLTVIENLIHLPKLPNSKLMPLQESKKMNIEPQLRFSSTKKKSSDKQNHVYQRPNEKESVSIKNILTDVPDFFISGSYNYDHMY